MLKIYIHQQIFHTILIRKLPLFIGKLVIKRVNLATKINKQQAKYLFVIKKSIFLSISLKTNQNYFLL